MSLDAMTPPDAISRPPPFDRSGCLGLEIGGSKLQMVTGNLHGAILERKRFTVDPQAGAAAIRTRIESVLRTVELSRFVGLGVGFGGPVDQRTGRIACSHQIEGWSDFDLRGWLTELTGLPVAVENDANTAALGEALLGAGRGLDPAFYVTLGSGVGGGLVCRGELYRGNPPGESEIGHLRLDRHGTIVEQRCSGWAVNRRIREAVAAGAGGYLARMVQEDPGHEARHLRPALERGDEIARGILAATADDLALALSHVTHLAHPAIIILGGGLSHVGEPLRTAVAERLPGLLMRAFQPGPAIALAALGEDAVPTGALLLAAAGLSTAFSGSHNRA